MPVARAARGGPSTSVRARASIDETRILRMNVTLRRTWTRNPTADLRRSAETIRRLFGVGKSPTLASAGPLRNPEVGLHKPETARAFASENPGTLTGPPVARELIGGPARHHAPTPVNRAELRPELRPHLGRVSGGAR